MVLNAIEKNDVTLAKRLDMRALLKNSFTRDEILESIDNSIKRLRLSHNLAGVI